MHDISVDDEVEFQGPSPNESTVQAVVKELLWISRIRYTKVQTIDGRILYQALAVLRPKGFHANTSPTKKNNSNCTFKNR